MLGLIMLCSEWFIVLYTISLKKYRCTEKAYAADLRIFMLILYLILRRIKVKKYLFNIYNNL